MSKFWGLFYFSEKLFASGSTETGLLVNVESEDVGGIECMLG